MFPLSEILTRDVETCILDTHPKIRTIGNLRTAVGSIAERIPHELGVSRGNRITIVCADPIYFLAALLAVFKTGNVAVLPPTHQSAWFEENEKTYDLVLTDKTLGCSVPNVRVDHPYLNGNSVCETLNPLHCQMVFFTSGSTSSPKPVAKNLAQLEAETRVLEKLWGTALGNAEIRSTVPHFHIYGLLFNLLWPLYAGRPINALQFSFVDDLVPNSGKAYAVVTSPAHLSRPSTERLPSGADTPKLVFSSGAPLHYQDAQASLSLFGKLPIEVYGSTETGGIGYRSQTTPSAEWAVFPQVEVGIRQNGCLRVRSPFTQNQEWFDTADLCSVNSKGTSFTLRGRNDRVAKIEGKRVSLARVEEILLLSEEVEDCVVLIDNFEGKERLAALVHLTDEGKIGLRNEGVFRFRMKLGRLAKSAEGAAFAPRVWRFVEEIPINSHGKRNLKNLENLLRTGEFS